MKSTLPMRSIANPRRTTLAHLEDGDALTLSTRPARPADAAETQTPRRTANPRRTVLVDAPAG